MTDERRAFQRLALTRALDGWFGDFSVRLLDVSASGARIESDETIPHDARALLRFYWEGEEIEITAEIVRKSGGGSAVHFLEANDTLNRLIAESAEEILRAQLANAEGDREANRIGDQTLTVIADAVSGSSSSYLTYRFDGTSWRTRASLLPDQPEDGFTVAASLQPDQIEMLCRTYESGDPESRRLTRLFAELSVARRH